MSDPTISAEERAKIRNDHRPDASGLVCWECEGDECSFPCVPIRLLDALEAAESRVSTPLPAEEQEPVAFLIEGKNVSGGYALLRNTDWMGGIVEMWKKADAIVRPLIDAAPVRAREEGTAGSGGSARRETPEEKSE